MAAGWKDDPSGQAQYRYFDGQRWTEHLSAHGIMFVDPDGPPAPGRYAIPGAAGWDPPTPGTGFAPPAPPAAPVAPPSRPVAPSPVTPAPVASSPSPAPSPPAASPAVPSPTSPPGAEFGYQPRTSNGLAIASLSIGMIGVLFGLVPFFFFIAGPCGILSVIFGLVAWRRSRHGAPHKGMSIFGTLFGLAALVLAVVGVVVLVDAVDTAIDEFDTDIEQTFGSDTAAPVDDTTPADNSTADTTPDDTTPADTTPDDTAPDAGSSDDAVAGAPTGSVGSRSDPVRAGEVAAIGDGWRLQILDVVDDGTERVMKENQFNERPRPGKRFTLVEVALGYYGFDDPQNALMLSISAVGASGRELGDDCGVVPDALDPFVDMFAGGVVTGNLCFVTERGDTDDLTLYAEEFFGDKVFLEARTPEQDATPMSPLTGPQPAAAATGRRTDARKVGTAAAIGDDWTMTVTSKVVDITDRVLAKNSFNEPPPKGFWFVGVEVELRYGGSDSSIGLDATIGAVGGSNVAYSQDCGVVPKALDLFDDVFTDGRVRGTVCFVVPKDELDSVVLYAYSGFDSDRTEFFAS